MSLKGPEKMDGTELEWRKTSPPNEVWVHVICPDTGNEIKARAIYGRDGVRPHWETEGGTLHEVSVFSKWRPIKDNWLSSKDELPKLENYYLVWIGGPAGELAIMYWNGSDWNRRANQPRPSHWQKITKPAIFM